MRRTRGVATGLLGLVLFAGCAGRFDYVRPASVETPPHVLIVTKSREEVWRQVSRSLVKDRFLLDGIDREAGVVTLTYAGDPEPYVDCGYITSYVTNVRGERTYRFAAATASTEYEIMTGTEILSIVRRLTLDARIAVTMTAVDTTATRISATTRYTLVRTMLVHDAKRRSRTISDFISFDTGQEATFPGAVACRASGMLETDVLSAFTP